MNCKALCGANLVTSRSKLRTNEACELQRVVTTGGQKRHYFLNVVFEFVPDTGGFGHVAR